jgi:hypothetical protein
VTAEAAEDEVTVSFIPFAAEHRRAVAAAAALGEGRGFGAVAQLPLLVAMSSLAAVFVLFAEGQDGWFAVLFVTVPVGFFSLGYGIATWPRRRTLVYTAGPVGITLRGGRRDLDIPWSRLLRVEERPEFFLLTLRTSGYYIPRRAGRPGGRGASAGPARRAPG